MANRCEACRGNGFRFAGEYCAECGGSGFAPPAEPVVEKCGNHVLCAAWSVIAAYEYDANEANERDMARKWMDKYYPPGTPSCKCLVPETQQPAEPPAVRERAEKYLANVRDRNVCAICAELMAAFAAEELSAFVREVEARAIDAKPPAHRYTVDYLGLMRAVLKERNSDLNPPKT